MMIFNFSLMKNVLCFIVFYCVLLYFIVFYCVLLCFIVFQRGVQWGVEWDYWG